MGKDYIYAVTPLIEDALMDRDLVHRQVSFCYACFYISSFYLFFVVLLLLLPFNSLLRSFAIFLTFFRHLLQTACACVKHMTLGVVGLGCEDALAHLLNFVWPNIFETSPHVINAVVDAIEAMRVALGPSIIMEYLLTGLFHPAR
jgi:splicing factor 3B subunit 1